MGVEVGGIAAGELADPLHLEIDLVHHVPEVTQLVRRRHTVDAEVPKLVVLVDEGGAEQSGVQGTELPKVQVEADATQQVGPALQQRDGGGGVRRVHHQGRGGDPTGDQQLMDRPVHLGAHAEVVGVEDQPQRLRAHGRPPPAPSSSSSLATKNSTPARKSFRLAIWWECSPMARRIPSSSSTRAV